MSSVNYLTSRVNDNGVIGIDGLHPYEVLDHIPKCRFEFVVEPAHDVQVS